MPFEEKQIGPDAWTNVCTDCGTASRTCLSCAVEYCPLCLGLLVLTDPQPCPGGCGHEVRPQ